MEGAQGEAVVLLSGGVDSSVLAHYVLRRLGFEGVRALSFAYGQRHEKELTCACTQAAAVAAVAHEIIDLSFMAGLLQAGSSLIVGGAGVPDLADLEAETLDQPPTYVPNRNMMLLALAAGYAEAQGIRDVFYGAQARDEYGYWDCTAAFVEGLNAVLALNRRQPVCVHAPFLEKSKGEIVALGLALGVDFADTWSCYRGGERACGTCPTCVERLKAFAFAGIGDPLNYA